MRSSCKVCWSLLAVCTLALNQCGSSGSSDKSQDYGEVVLELRLVPDHVACFELTAVATRRVRRTFPVVGSPIVEHVQGIPTGQSVSFEGAAYADANCTGTATWVSDPLSTAVEPAVPTTIRLTLRPNGIANVEPSFVADREAPVVDQSVRNPGGLAALINEGCRYIGQTYRAGITGVLYGVAVDVQYAYFDVPLHVALRTLVENVPQSTSLADVVLSSARSPLDSYVLFPQTVRQTAGDTYAIIVDYPSAPPAGPNQGSAVWTGVNPADGNVYPAGGMLCGQQDGVTWSLSSGVALRFETKVYPD